MSLRKGLLAATCALGIGSVGSLVAHETGGNNGPHARTVIDGINHVGTIIDKICTKGSLTVPGVGEIRDITAVEFGKGRGWSHTHGPDGAATNVPDSLKVFGKNPSGADVGVNIGLTGVVLPYSQNFRAEGICSGEPIYMNGFKNTYNKTEQTIN